MSDDEEKRFYQFFSRFGLILFAIFCALLCSNIYFGTKFTNRAIDICTDKTTKKLDIECLSAIKKIYE